MTMGRSAGERPTSADDGARWEGEAPDFCLLSQFQLPLDAELGEPSRARSEARSTNLD